jgi:predicted unusual protein kinase regulating ubiquinone biosynthesis (AarF/ABC1/UbiB family)
MHCAVFNSWLLTPSAASLLLLLQFVDELGKLQDRVPAFSADKAEAIIERDLGQPVSKVRCQKSVCMQC